MDRDVIFVVDDQASNIEVVTALLERANYEVVPALSGEEVLEHCLRRTPSLVLLDMRMPVMDGFEVCEHLRANPRTADVPIIFLTAARERESVIQGFQHGAVDYVTKPFVAEELLARVKTHVELKRARDHLRWSRRSAPISPRSSRTISRIRCRASCSRSTCSNAARTAPRRWPPKSASRPSTA